MTRRSTLRRLVLLAASTGVITGGVLLPTSAFAAPPPRTASVATADAGSGDAAGWSRTTDTTSGISVRLPDRPLVQQNNEDGVRTRLYLVPTEYGAIGFSVFEAPGTDPSAPWDLKATLSSVLEGYNSDAKSSREVLRSTGAHAGTTKGSPDLGADLTAADGSRGHIRLIDLGEHMVVVMTVSERGHQDLMDKDHRQVLDSVRVPGDDATRSGDSSRPA